MEHQTNLMYLKCLHSDGSIINIHFGAYGTNVTYSILNGIMQYNTNEIHELSFRNATNEEGSSVDSIMEFLEDHIDALTFAKNQDLVFVMGSEKSYKSTLALFLIKAELEVIETVPGLKDFVFVDKDGEFRDYSPNIVLELIPELYPNKETGLEYYVMPEFTVLSDVKCDITAAHLIQRSQTFNLYLP